MAENVNPGGLISRDDVLPVRRQSANRISDGIDEEHPDGLDGTQFDEEGPAVLRRPPCLGLQARAPPADAACVVNAVLSPSPIEFPTTRFAVAPGPSISTPTKPFPEMVLPCPWLADPPMVFDAAPSMKTPTMLPTRTLFARRRTRSRCRSRRPCRPPGDIQPDEIPGNDVLTDGVVSCIRDQDAVRLQLIAELQDLVAELRCWPVWFPV